MTGRIRKVIQNPCLVCCMLLTAAQLVEADSVRLLPPIVHLKGPDARHQILIEEFNADSAIGHVNEPGRLISSNPAIVRVDGRTLLPTGNGIAQVTIEGGFGDEAVQVTVTDFESETHWSFRNHVQPILARQGCNSGASFLGQEIYADRDNGLSDLQRTLYRHPSQAMDKKCFAVAAHHGPSVSSILVVSSSQRWKTSTTEKRRLVFGNFGNQPE